MVYKYIDIEGAEKALSKSTIKFSKAKYTNDPFECSKELIDFGDIKKLVDFHIHHFHSKASIKWIRDNRPKMIMAFQKNDFRIIFDNYRERIAFASFSKSPDIPLLWSYYAEKHKGICIGYNLDNGLFNDEGRNVFASPVNYMTEIQKIYFDPEKNSEFVGKWITTKSFHWQHEKEVRLIYLRFPYVEEYKCIFHDKKMISKIVFGINTEQAAIDKVTSIINDKYPNQEIIFSKMKIGSELFTLEEVPYIP
jgi:hypothetical protein